MDRAAAEVARQNYAIEVRCGAKTSWAAGADFNTMCRAFAGARGADPQERIATIGGYRDRSYTICASLAAIYGARRCWWIRNCRRRT